MDVYYALGEAGLRAALELVHCVLDRPQWDDDALERAKEVYHTSAKTVRRRAEGGSWGLEGWRSGGAGQRGCGGLVGGAAGGLGRGGGRLGCGGGGGCCYWAARRPLPLGEER
jgi:hypothetical protein